MKLNNAQQRAMQAIKGRILVLAGAGSGKTRVLTLRINHLIKNKNVAPENILGLTFTNKAAREMRERLAGTIGKSSAKKVTLTTFHSFCLRILRAEIHHLGYTQRFSLYTEKEIGRLVETQLRQKLKTEDKLPPLSEVITRLNHARSYDSDPAEIEFDHPNWDPKVASELVEEIKQSMRAYNAVDFDSLLTLTVQLFREKPEILERYQERFQYIMIDEYQDTNQVQYELTSMLARKHNNLFVVGDDDQSIYGWRGAEIKHILQFESDEVIKLEQNYRSTPLILQGANAVIRNNSERHDKQLFSDTKAGELIRLFHAPTEREEAEAVLQRMLYLRKHYNVAWNEMAILYRSNVLAREIESVLMRMSWKDGDEWKRGIPYHVSGGTEFYDRSEIKDFLCYLRCIANTSDQEAMLRIINVPRRGISASAIDLLTKKQRLEKMNLWELLQEVAKDPESFEYEEKKLSKRAGTGVQEFVELIQKAITQFEEKPLSEAAIWMVDESRMRDAIEQEVKSDKMRNFKMSNVNTCAESVATYEEDMKESDEKASLSHFLTSSMLDKDHFNKRKERTDGVNVMTFHSAKGLEFDACFLIGLEDHILPHEKSAGKTGLEEERRLLYVAMTRAKKYLTMSMSRTRNRYGKQAPSAPSRFLHEIPKEIIKMSSWNALDW